MPWIPAGAKAFKLRSVVIVLRLMLVIGKSVIIEHE